MVNEEERPFAKDFFNSWFRLQNIEPITFFACVSLIMDRRLYKKNALLLRGTSNSGKSLMVRLLFQNYPCTFLGRSGETSPFHLQPLLSKPLAIFEETRITPATIDDFKMVFGGESLDVDVKGSDHETLTRRPCILTCNQPLASTCAEEDVVALSNRIITFVCDTPLTKQLPFELTQAHLVYFLNESNIWELIEEKSAEIIADNDLLPIAFI